MNKQSRLQELIEQAIASLEETIELQVFLSPDQCRGLRDFSMYDLQTYAYLKPVRILSQDFVHGVIPIEWCFVN